MCYLQPSTTSRTVLQDGQDKTSKASPKKRSIIEYSPGLNQDYKSLRSCSGNWERYSSKGNLVSNVTPNIKRSSDPSSRVPPIVNEGDWGGCIVHDLETITVSLSYSHSISFPKGHTSTNPDKVTDQRLCCCNSNTWGWPIAIIVE